jgi:hypothetical protein
MATIAISAPASLARGLARGVAVRAGASAKTTLVPRAVRRDEIRVGGFASRRGVAARAVDGDEKTKDSKDVLDSLSSILGIDPEEELRAQRAEEERVEKELREAREEQDAARAARAANEAGKTKPPVVTRAVSGGSGSRTKTPELLTAPSRLCRTSFPCSTG